MQRIDHCSSRCLHRNPDQSPEGQNIANLTRIPSTRSKISSQERPETRLHVGQKEIQPFERPQFLLACSPRVIRTGSSHLFVSNTLDPLARAQKGQFYQQAESKPSMQ
jgi:hypothetical protein